MGISKQKTSGLHSINGERIYGNCTRIPRGLTACFFKNEFTMMYNDLRSSD